DQQPVPLSGPARIVRSAVAKGGELLSAEPRLGSEVGDVYPPLVLAAASRAGAIDHDLPLAQAKREFLAQLVGAPTAHGAGHRQVLGEGPEQCDRRFAGRHHRAKLLVSPGVVGRLEGINSRHVASVTNSVTAIVVYDNVTESVTSRSFAMA